MSAQYFRCLDVRSVREKVEAGKEKQRIARQAADDYALSLGGVKLVGVQFFAGGFAVEGFRADSFTELPVGWRFDAKKRMAVPAKRTDEGKEIVSILRSIACPNNVLPGFPSDVSIAGFTLYPRLEELGDKIFIKLSKPSEADSFKRNPYDETLWEPVKASAYHLAKESDVENATV